LLLRAGQSPLEPRLVTAPGGNANRKRATPIKLVGSRQKSNPARRLNRVWPDTGPTDNRLTAATELILTALELPDVQRSWLPYVPPIVGTIGSGETPAATAWATVRTSAR